MTSPSQSEGEPQTGLPQADETHWKIGRGLAEVLTGLAFSAIAGYFLLLGKDLPDSNFNPTDPGTAAFPDTLAWALLACSIAILLFGIFRMFSSEKGEGISITEPLNVIGTILLTVLYAFSMPFVTYYVATIVWAPLVLLLSGIRSWKWIVSLTILTLLVAHFVFERVLSANLP